MNDDTLRLSRRRALAALGTIGVASAGAGLGTSAYFSDRETYENNTLTAGSLDMKVEWSEHYSDWSDDETDGIPPEATVGDNTFDTVLMERPDRRVGRYTGFPIGARGGAGNDDKGVWILDEYVGDFMDNTALEAYPDPDDDGVQNEPEGYDVCADGADTPEALDPTAEGALRSDNDDTWDVEAEEPRPLVAVEDVKPGDFGEVTFTFALCDNPGYVWLQGELVRAAENGHTEPEAADPDEVGGPNTENDTGNDVELLDAIQVALWHDHDCDNLRDRATRPAWRDREGEAVHGGIDGDGGVDSNELWIDPETGERIPDQQGARGRAITSLREFLAALETEGEGQNVAGLPLDGDAATEGRDCFPARDEEGNVVGHCIGLSWWVPVDHANEIQTDAVEFDLGFYTEQCRHNDGSGMAPEDDDEDRNGS